MSMQIDNANPVDLVQQSQQNEESKSEGNVAQEAMQKWIYALIIQGFKNLGQAQDGNNDENGGQDVAANGPISLEELKTLSNAALAGSDAAVSAGTELLEELFGQNLNADKTVYFDEGVNDPDLLALFGGNLPLNPNALSNAATAEEDGPIIISGDGDNPTANAETTDPVVPASEYSPTFGVDGGGEDISIYGLAALVLLTTMENKRNIVANRLDQIESTNNRVQRITTTISNLKAAKSGLEKDSDETNVPVEALVTLAESNLGPTGEIDEAGTQKFLTDLGLDDDQISDIYNAGPDQEIKLSKAQIDAVIEKLTSQSEALSTQNQTRNIKLQQQISELQVSTQMTSAIIDQIKTLGSGIAQRL